MEINKEIKKVNCIIKRIFDSTCNEFVRYNQENYSCNFKYDNYLIKCYKASDRDYKNFLEISLKYDGSDYLYQWCQFHMLYLYYEDKSFNKRFTIKSLEQYLKLLKKYIDSDKIFYDFSSKDFKNSYFYMEGVIREVSTKFTPESALEERFHEEKYRIINNKIIYK